MDIANLKKGFYGLIFVSCVLLVSEICHFLLPSDPDGVLASVDEFFHLAHFAAFGIYPVALFTILYSAYSYDRNQSSIWAFALIIAVCVQIGLHLSIDARVGSSRYTPSPPDVFGPLVLMTLTFFASRKLAQLVSLRIVATVVCILWFLGALIDIIWITEMTNRGTGLVWQLPGISSLLAGLTMSLALFSYPFSFFDPLYAAIVLAVSCSVYSIYRKNSIIETLAFSMSLFLVVLKKYEWLGFLLD